MKLCLKLSVSNVHRIVDLCSILHFITSIVMKKFGEKKNCDSVIIDSGSAYTIVHKGRWVCCYYEACEKVQGCKGHYSEYLYGDGIICFELFFGW